MTYTHILVVILLFGLQLANAQCGTVPCGVCPSSSSSTVVITGTPYAAAFVNDSGSNLNSDPSLLIGGLDGAANPRIVDYRTVASKGAVWRIGAWSADKLTGSPNANVIGGGLGVYGTRGAGTTLTSTNGGAAWLKSSSLEFKQIINGVASNNQFAAAYIGVSTTGFRDGLFLTDDTATTRFAVSRSTGKVQMKGYGDSAAVVGTATLASGSTTVHTTAVTANTLVSLTRHQTLGSPGHLSASGLVAGIGFNITSSDSHDTSSVFWFLVDQI